MSEIKMLQGDCLELMKDIPSKSVDMILCDLPYGTTDCKWDTIIPFDKLWEQYSRVIKDNGAIVLFGTEPFSSKLRLSNLKMYRYDWVWNKRKGANFAQSNKQPFKIHEIISIFSKKQCIYYPQKHNAPKVSKRYLCKLSNNLNSRKDAGGIGGVIKYSKLYEPDKLLPVSIIDFKKDNYKGNIYHPTQKPVALLEYLIKTYTNENELVLDNCAGSMSTAIACLNTNRNGIMIEKDEHYFEVGKNRVEQRQKELYGSN